MPLVVIMQKRMVSAFSLHWHPWCVGNKLKLC